MDWTVADWILNICVLLIGGGLLLGLIQIICEIVIPWEKEFTTNARVKSLSFTPSQTSTGVGISSDGHAVVTTSSTSETNVVVLIIDGIGRYDEDDENMFNSVDIGDKLTLQMQRRKCFLRDQLRITEWKKESLK